MKQTPPNGTAEQHVREIHRQTRKKYSSEEKKPPLKAVSLCPK